VVRYSLEHFQWEEEVMARIDDVIEERRPDQYAEFSLHYRAHLSEHLALTQSTMIYKGQFEEHTVSALSLYVFVRHWLISHVNKMDRELSRWCRIADGLPDA
jgi:hemerythrin